MPSFFKDLRRRSRATMKSETHNDSASSHESNDSQHEGSSQSTQSNPVQTHERSTSSGGMSPFLNGKPGESPALRNTRSQSSTNLSSLNPFGSKTPPMSNTPPLNGSTPPWGNRPGMQNQGSRYSIVGSVSGGSPRTTSYTSPLAPRVTSVSDGSWVHQKVLLISGVLGDSSQITDGNLYIAHHQDSFPPTEWPVCDSHFKALVHLQPGPNRLRIDFVQPQRPSQSGSPVHSSTLNINYLPLVSSPPLQLAILVGRDSPMTFDAMPERARTEGNGIETAVRKYRMAAYLWQAFTGEQMNRNGFGRRCYRYEEEWQPGTLSRRDNETGQMRNEAKIHVIRLKQTTAEIRDLNIAQQYGPATNKDALFSIAIDTCKEYFKHKSGQKQYVSCLYLDAHWDKHVGVIRGHAAVGGGADGLQIAICGSHALQSYPSHIEEVVPAFTDCTRTDTDYVANDLNESGSNWEAANIGIGAHMHETGHLFGCPHQENGVMLRDYVRLNRTFTCREPYSTRTKSQGPRLCLTTDECAWHRMDVLRFRFHPCFQLPTDLPPAGEEGIQVWSVDNGAALITATSGVAWIEITPAGDDVCHYWIEYADQANGGGPRQISLTEEELRSRVGQAGKGRKLKLQVFSCGGGEHTIEDFSQIVSKTARIKLPDGRSGFRGSKLGFSQMEGTQHQDLVMESAYIQTKLLVNVKIYSGASLDGLEFCYEDGTSQLFGKRGGKQGGDNFPLDTRRGETVFGFYLRAGAWIDGIQIITSNGRRSEVYGNATGGSGHTLLPPRGYQTVGIYGSCGPWVDGFGLIISR